jgi:enediyne biosynthesis protein E4
VGVGLVLVVAPPPPPQARAVVSQASYYSHDDLRAHFGLGTARRADRIEVRWPSGAVDVRKDVEGRRVVIVREGQP